MSTFVVRFVGDSTQGYRGRVRHVPSGEEANFANLEALLTFFEQARGRRPPVQPSETKPSTPLQTHRKARRRESS